MMNFIQSGCADETRGPARPKPDAELIQLCAEFHRYRAAARDIPLDNIMAFNFALNVLRLLCASIMGFPMVTEAGQRAVAGVAIAMLADGADPFETRQ